MVDCSEGSQLENIYCGCVYCTLKGAGPDKSNISRDGIGDVWTKYENCFCRTEMNVNVPLPSLQQTRNFRQSLHPACETCSVWMINLFAKQTLHF